MAGHVAGAAGCVLARPVVRRVPGSRVTSTRGATRNVRCEARRGVSPLSGEPYHDDDISAYRTGGSSYGSSYDRYDPPNAGGYDSREYDEVTTTLWLPMRDLGLGDVGTDVGMLQQAFGVQPTGVFDKTLAREVARWQANIGLNKTGYFGVASREAFARQAADTASAARNRVSGNAGSYRRNARYQYDSQRDNATPSIDSLKPKTTARSGRETYRAGVSVPTHSAPSVPTQSVINANLGPAAIALAAVAAFTGAAVARREGLFASDKNKNRNTRSLRKTKVATAFDDFEFQVNRFRTNGIAKGADTRPPVGYGQTAPRSSPAPRNTAPFYAPPSSLDRNTFGDQNHSTGASQSGGQNRTASAWTGITPFDELVGFAKKPAVSSGVDETRQSIQNRVASAAVSATEYGNAEAVAKARTQHAARINAVTKDAENRSSSLRSAIETVADRGDRGGFAANLPKKPPALDRPGAGSLPDGKEELGTAGTGQTVRAMTNGDTKPDNVGGVIGGVLKKVFGLRGKKKSTASEPFGTRKTETSQTPVGKGQQQKETKTDEDSTSETDKTEEKKSLAASDQMARLALLREEETERLAKIAKGRDGPGTSPVSTAPTFTAAAPTQPTPQNAQNAPGLMMDEKEMLLRERRLLMQAQHDKAEKKAAKKKEDEFAARVLAARVGKVVPPPPPPSSPSSHSSTPSPPETSETETEDTRDTVRPPVQEDTRPPVQGWQDVPSVAPPARAETEMMPPKPPKVVLYKPSKTQSERDTGTVDAGFVVPPMPEKSFDDMTFEERVAQARRVSRTSGVADAVGRALAEERSRRSVVKKEEPEVAVTDERPRNIRGVIIDTASQAVVSTRGDGDGDGVGDDASAVGRVGADEANGEDDQVTRSETDPIVGDDGNVDDRDDATKSYTQSDSISVTSMDDGWRLLETEIQTLAGDDFYARVAAAKEESEAVGDGGSSLKGDVAGVKGTVDMVKGSVDGQKGTVQSRKEKEKGDTKKPAKNDVAAAMAQGTFVFPKS